MVIKLFGNCSIQIESKNTQILLDPYFSNKGNPAFKRGSEVSTEYRYIDNLDGILLSHEHFDHMDMEFLKKFKGKCPLYGPIGIKGMFLNRRTVKPGDKFTINDIEIEVVKARHVCPTVGYIIKSENKTIYFAGDTYYRDFMKEIGEKYSIDVALLPVTNYQPPMTMNKESAVKALKVLKPKYFIPMHKDLVKRTNPKNCTVTKAELVEILDKNQSNVTLIYLENGQMFKF